MARDNIDRVDVLIVEDVWGPAFDTLAANHSVVQEPDLWADRERLIARARGCRGLVVRNRTRVDAALLAELPDLEIVGRAGAGLDNIDVDAADRAGVVVVAARGANAQSVAEHALALGLALARDVVGHDAATRTGGWSRSPGIELAGRTWGVLGAGATGQAVGRLASALGMRVLGHDPHLAADNPAVCAAGIDLVALDRVVAESDVLSIHLPATPETRNLVDRAFLHGMRPGALLINVGRGEVVDEDALADALVDHRIGGAGLDVRASEPPGPGPLDKLDNVVLTPHVAGITGEAQDRVAAVLADDFAALFDGGVARNAAGSVNKLASDETSQ